MTIVFSSSHVTRFFRMVLMWSLALLILPFLLSTNLLLTVGFVVAERALYLPVAGSAIVVVRGWQKLKLRCQVWFCCVNLIIIFHSLQQGLASSALKLERRDFPLHLSAPSSRSALPPGKQLWEKGEIDSIKPKFRARHIINHYMQTLKNILVHTFFPNWFPIPYKMPYLLDQGEFLEGEKEYKSAIRIATIPKAVYYGNLGVLYHRCLKCQLFQ